MKNNLRKYPLLLSLSIILIASLLVSCAGGATQIKTNWPEVSVDPQNETAYFSAGSFLHAINLSNGSEKWHFPAEANRSVSFYAAPAIAPDNQIILAGYDHKIYSLDANTGMEKWRFTEATNLFVATPLVDGPGIYAPSSDDFLYALNLDGSLHWKYKTDQDLWSTPASDAKLIYLPSMNHHLYAIDIESGNQVWQSEVLGGAVPGKPALSEDGVLYVGTIAAEMLAIDSRDGHVLWRVPAGGWIWSGPRLEGDRLFYGDMDGSVFAVDAKTGGIIWRIQPDAGPDRAITGTPLVMGDVLYFGASSGILYAVKKVDGSPVWNKTFEGKLHFGPVGAGDRILISVTGKNLLLVALDQNGNQVWSFGPQK